MSSIEVIIPHLDRAESLARALAALRAQTLVPEITVVDNGSRDGSLEMLAAGHPEVRVIALGSNHGFGAAVNRGIAASEAELVILLNNDTVADPAFVERILAAQRREGAEMVCGCLRRPDGRIESLGVEVDRSLVAYDVWFGEPYERAAREQPPPALAPCGGAGAYLRAALEEVGGFDERIFAYLEDVELGIRMRLAEMRCASAPDAFAWHEHSGTLGSGAPAKNRLMGASRGYLLWKHGSGRSVRERARGALVDTVTYAGQAVVDRNLGALRGRLDARRRHAGVPRPPADPRMGTLPYAERRLSQTLATRFARRRRTGSPGKPPPGPAPGGRA